MLIDWCLPVDRNQDPLLQLLGLSRVGGSIIFTNVNCGSPIHRFYQQHGEQEQQFCLLSFLLIEESVKGAGKQSAAHPAASESADHLFCR